MLLSNSYILSTHTPVIVAPARTSQAGIQSTESIVSYTVTAKHRSFRRKMATLLHHLPACVAVVTK